ncbi:MAG: lipoprotein [Ideonella sp. WA131b]|nr:lipoprotein [Ideonella sp. WA131b]
MGNRLQTSLSTRFAGVAVMVAGLALAGCGQKGPLTLPKPSAAAPAAAASAPATAAPR